MEYCLTDAKEKQGERGRKDGWVAHFSVLSTSMLPSTLLMWASLDLHKTQGWAHSQSDISLTILLGATSDRDGIERKSTEEKNPFGLLQRHLASRTRHARFRIPRRSRFQKSHCGGRRRKGPDWTTRGGDARPAEHKGARREVTGWGSAGVEQHQQLQSGRRPAGTCPRDTGAGNPRVPAGVRGQGEELEREPGRAQGPPRRGPRRRPGKGDRAQREAERGVRPHVREPQVPGGGACTPACARVHTRTCREGGTGWAGERQEPGGARRGTHRPLTPAPTPPRRPTPQDSTAGLPFSSLHTFFFLLLGYMLPWGWLALSCKFPRLTGKQGVCGVGGWGGGTREGKSERGSGSRAARRSPVAALLPQPALGSGSHPPQPHGRRHSSTSEPVN